MTYSLTQQMSYSHGFYVLFVVRFHLLSTQMEMVYIPNMLNSYAIIVQFHGFYVLSVLAVTNMTLHICH